LLLLTACPSQVRSNDPMTRDREIERDILWKFHHDPRFDNLSAPSCHDGEVVLKGRVTTTEARAEAEKIGFDTRSVRAVRNLIEVKPK
jgi:hypothetical protein